MSAETEWCVDETVRKGRAGGLPVAYIPLIDTIPLPRSYSRAPPKSHCLEGLYVCVYSSLWVYGLDRVATSSTHTHRLIDRGSKPSMTAASSKLPSLATMHNTFSISSRSLHFVLVNALCRFSVPLRRIS